MAVCSSQVHQRLGRRKRNEQSSLVGSKRTAPVHVVHSSDDGMPSMTQQCGRGAKRQKQCTGMFEKANSNEEQDGQFDDAPGDETNMLVHYRQFLQERPLPPRQQGVSQHTTTMAPAFVTAPSCQRQPPMLPSIVQHRRPSTTPVVPFQSSILPSPPGERTSLLPTLRQECTGNSRNSLLPPMMPLMRQLQPPSLSPVVPQYYQNQIRLECAKKETCAQLQKLGMYAAAHALDKSYSVTVPNEDYTYSDVLFGRGTRSNNHAGNMLLRNLAKLHCDDYEHDATRSKQQVAQCVINVILQNGGRFLIQERQSRARAIQRGGQEDTTTTGNDGMVNDLTWVPADPKIIMNKTQHLFRKKTRRVENLRPVS